METSQLEQRSEPRRLEYRAAALSIVVVAALSAYRLALDWIDLPNAPLLIPFMVAFLLFHIGYVWGVGKAAWRSIGARLGGYGIALNLLTMLSLPMHRIVWAAVSLCALGLFVVGAAFLFKDASRASK